jgi:arylsulfatase A-like enzyme
LQSSYAPILEAAQVYKVFLALLTLTIALAGGCVDSDDTVVDKVLLISIDTLRADYLGVYNPVMRTSPNLDALAEESVVFTDAITQATSTLASHTSLFYSMHTFVHRAYLNSQPEPKVTVPMVALRDAGFLTAAFVGGGQLRPQFGVNRGFDIYEVINTRNINQSSRGRDRLGDLHDEVAAFLRHHRDDRFFLFVHTYEPHWPYDPPQEFIDAVEAQMDSAALGRNATPRDLQEYEVGFGVTEDAYLATNRRAMYAAVVAYVDHFMGRLLATIQEMGLDDRLMIVFIADHGESLGERGVLGHNRFYTEQLRVPLIIRVPGVEARRTDVPVQLIDVLPTIISALAVDPPYEFMGQSLMPLLLGDESVVDRGRVRFSENKGSAGVLRGPWKIVFNLDNPALRTLYNLEEDPGELINRAPQQPELAEELVHLYYGFAARHRSIAQQFPHNDLDVGELGPDVLRELRALGYIQ